MECIYLNMYKINILFYDTFRAKSHNFLSELHYTPCLAHSTACSSHSLSLSLSLLDTALSEFRKSLASELLSGYISCTDCGRSSRSVFGSEAQSSLSLEPWVPSGLTPTSRPRTSAGMWRAALGCLSVVVLAPLSLPIPLLSPRAASTMPPPEGPLPVCCWAALAAPWIWTSVTPPR